MTANRCGIPDERTKQQWSREQNPIRGRRQQPSPRCRTARKPTSPHRSAPERDSLASGSRLPALGRHRRRPALGKPRIPTALCHWWTSRTDRASPIARSDGTDALVCRSFQSPPPGAGADVGGFDLRLGPNIPFLRMCVNKPAQPPKTARRAAAPLLAGLRRAQLSRDDRGPKCGCTQIN
jgi:hypothetical protein